MNQPLRREMNNSSNTSFLPLDNSSLNEHEYVNSPVRSFFFRGMTAAPLEEDPGGSFSRN